MVSHGTRVTYFILAAAWVGNSGHGSPALLPLLRGG
jgi:hypothetical protein